MDTKMNTSTNTKTQSDSLNLQKVQDNWGLCAFYEGYRLIFSGVFDINRVRKEKWGKLWPFYNPKNTEHKKNLTEEVDVYNMFSHSAKHAWNRAFVKTSKQHRPVGVEDLFLALLEEPTVKNLLRRIKVSTHTAEKFLNNYLKLNHQNTTQTLQQIPFQAFNFAMKLHNRKIGSLMLLGALLENTPQDNILQAIFTNIGLTTKKLEIFSVWILNLNYEFPKNSEASQLLFCCQQTQLLESHFGYFYELPAIETAVSLARNYYTDMRHLKAMQYLIKAGLIAKEKNNKLVTAKMVSQAAQ